MRSHMTMQKSAMNRLRASQPRLSCALSRHHIGRRGLATSCTASSHSDNRTEKPVRAISRCDAPSVSRSRQSIPAFLAAAALIVSTSAPCGAALAEEIYSAGPSQYRYPAAERYSEQQEGRFDEYLQTAELKSLLEMLTSGGSPKLQELEQARLKVGKREAMRLSPLAAEV